MLSAATQRLGTSPPPPSRESGPPSEPLITQITFDRDDAGYFADIRSIGRKTGVRVVRTAGETCVALAESTTLVLAILLDLVPPDAGAATPARVAPAVQPVPPPAPPHPEPALSSPLAISLGVDAGLAAGLLDHVAAGTLGAAVRPSYGRWELGVGALWAPTRNFPYETGSVDVTLLGARLTGCGWVTPLQSRFGLAGCAGALLAVLWGAGKDFDHDLTTHQFWPNVEFGLRGRLVLNEHFAIRLGVSGLVPLRHLTFSVEGRSVAYETPSFGVLGELGPELRFE